MNKINLRKYTVTLVTTCVLAALLSFYFLFYVGGNDQVIRDRNFRILNRTISNINERLKDQQQLFLTTANSITKPKGIYGLLDNNSNVMEYRLFQQNYDTLQARRDTARFIRGVTGIMRGKNAKADTAFFTPPGKEKLNDVYIHESYDSVYIYFQLRDDIHVDSITLSQFGTLTFGVRLSKFLTSVINPDAFEHYMLVRNGKVLYKDFVQGIIIENFDSLFKSDVTFKSNSYETIKFSGSNYALFIAPFSIGSDKDFALIGMLPESTLNAEKYSVPHGFILFVLITLMLILLSFPLIKAMLMSENERLTTLDVLSAFLCFVVSFGFILFILFHVYTIQWKEEETNDEQLSELAQSLKKSFANDISDAYRQMVFYDSCVKYVQSAVKNIGATELSFEDCFNFKCWNPSTSRSVLKPFYPYFKNVSWFDNKGNPIYTWTTEDRFQPNVNVAEREYFKRIINGATWMLPDSTRAPFAMQPVLSWRDGSYRMVLSRKCNHSFDDTIANPLENAVVNSISTNLPSLYSTVLSDGFTFTLINEKGEVWYHSDKRKNLNENLLDECGRNQKILSSLFAGTSSYFDCYYAGSNQRGFITPVDGLPLSIVVMKDKDLKGTRNLEVFSLTTAFYLSLFLMLVILFSAFILMRWKLSKLKKNFLQMTWLFPSAGKGNIYLLVSFLNLLLLITGFIITSPGHPLFSYLIFVTNIIVTISAFYYLGISDEYYFNRKKTERVFIALLSVIIIFLLICATNCLEGEYITYFCLYIIYCVLTSIMFFTDTKLSNTVVRKIFSGFSEKLYDRLGNKYGHAYSVLLFSWMMLVVFLPVVRFYETAHLYENTALVKLNQLSIARQINALTDNTAAGDKIHFDYIDSLFIDDSVKVASESSNPPPRFTLIDSLEEIRTQLKKSMKDFRNVYVSNSYSTRIQFNDSSAIEHSYADKEQKVFAALLKSIRIKYNGVSVNENDLFSVNTFSRPYDWVQSNNNELIFRYIDLNASDTNRFNKAPSLQQEDSLTIVSVIPSTGTLTSVSTFTNARGFAFILILTLIMFFLFKALRYFVSKFFLVEYFPFATATENNPSFLTSSHLARTENYHTKFVLISLPNSGKKQYMRKIFDEILPAGITDREKVERFIAIDLALIDTPKWEYQEKHKLANIRSDAMLVLYHFEYKLGNTEVNEKKIIFFESVLRKKIQNVIISSTIHPIAFLSTLKKDKTKADISQVASEGNYFRWAIALSSFSIVYYPITHLNSVPEKWIRTRENFIDSELAFGRYLANLKVQFDSKQASKAFDENDADEIVLSVQHLASAYYASVWNSLSREEQYVLHDMAEDGLANYKNREALSLLFNKGILINLERLQIMNRSFKNYILTEVKADHILNDKSVRSEGSMWQKFRVPFFIILLTVMFFIFKTQAGVFNKFIAIVASFTASLPLLMKLFTMFPSGKTSKTE